MGILSDIRKGESMKLYRTKEIASEYGKSGRWLNKYLKDKGIIYLSNTKWILVRSLRDQGLRGDYKTYKDKDSYYKWTEKGYQFIKQLLEDDLIFQK